MLIGTRALPPTPSPPPSALLSPHVSSYPQWEAHRRSLHGGVNTKGMFALSPIWAKRQEAEILWWSCRRKLGWVESLLLLSIVLSLCGVLPGVMCHWAPGVSCRGNSCQPHSSVVQASKSSSDAFIQCIYHLVLAYTFLHIHIPYVCACAQEQTLPALCGTNSHVTRLMHGL